jgi:multiple sugar transport system substrate-binding protein
MRVAVVGTEPHGGHGTPVLNCGSYSRRAASPAEREIMNDRSWQRSVQLSRRRFIRGTAALAGIAAIGPLAACGGGNSKPGAATGSTSASSRINPVDSVDLTGKKIELSFWHQTTGPKADKLNAVAAAFNSSQSIVTVKPEYQGTYTDIYKKLLTSISGGQLPDLAVAYPSQVSEYQSANAVIPLDDYVSSSKYGLSKTELDDFIGAYLNENKYPEYGNKLLSFPFAKSLLVLYYNADRLKTLNYGKTPDQWTWDDFAAVAKAANGGTMKGWAIDIDASTFDGMVFSRGGKLISDDQKHWLLNQQQGVDSLALHATAVREGWGYKTTQTGADQVDFGAARAALLFATSSNLANETKEVNGSGRFNWSVANLPHAAGVSPATVLYGGSVAMFKTNPEKQLAAWQFIKYFTTPEVTADWSVATGYMPVRQSAVQSDKVQAEIKSNPPYGIVVTQVAQYGHPETSVRGTQDTRTYIEDALTKATTDPSLNAKQTMDAVVQKGDQALAQA